MLRALGAVLALVITASCGGGESATPPVEIEPLCTPAEREGEAEPLEGALTCTLEAHITIEVAGAEEFSHETTTFLAINEFYEGDLPETAWFANAGMGTPVNLTETMLYRVRLDVAPGTYRGPGTYELTSERPDVEGLSSPLTDSAALEVTDLDPERTGEPLRAYGGFAEPCRLEVSEHLTRGSLSCPALVDEEGASISLEFRWRPADTSGE